MGVVLLSFKCNGPMVKGGVLHQNPIVFVVVSC